MQMTVRAVSTRKRRRGRCLKEENVVHGVMWNCLVLGVGALMFRIMLCVWNL